MLESVSMERGRALVNGKTRYTLILSQDGEMLAKEVEAPWRYVAEGVRLSESAPLHWQGGAELLSVRARTDSERVAMDAEIFVWLCLQSATDIEAVSSMKIGAAIERPEGEVLLCYPDRSDTLWSVGKRYAVALDTLVQSNRIENGKRADEAGSLGDAHVLIVS